MSVQDRKDKSNMNYRGSLKGFEVKLLQAPE
jgi:hypothetical protein